MWLDSRGAFPGASCCRGMPSPALWRQRHQAGGRADLGASERVCVVLLQLLLLPSHCISVHSVSERMPVADGPGSGSLRGSSVGLCMAHGACNGRDAGHGVMAGALPVLLCSSVSASLHEIPAKGHEVSRHRTVRADGAGTASGSTRRRIRTRQLGRPPAPPC